MLFSGSNCAVIEEEIQTTKKCLGVSISFKLCGPNNDVPRFYVASINDDSPALLSSIKPGDQILKINSQVIFGSDVVKFVTDLQNYRIHGILSLGRLILALDQSLTKKR